MSHKLQLHLLLDHISAKITANAAIGLCSLAKHFSCPIHPLCLGTKASRGRKNSHLLQHSGEEVKRLPFPGPAFTSRIFSLADGARWAESRQSPAEPQAAAAWDLIISGVRPIMTADRFYMRAKLFLVFQFPSSLKRLLIYIIINSLKDDNLQQLMRSFTEHIIFKLTGIKSLFQTM